MWRHSYNNNNNSNNSSNNNNNKSQQLIARETKLIYLLRNLTF